MIIVVVDYDQKNAVRGVYRVPENIPTTPACYLISQSYRKAAADADGSNRQPDEYLDGTGIIPEEFEIIQPFEGE
jgi:hypothetical protein